MLKARIETVLAILASVLAVATLIWPTWIESVLGFEPDAGSGGAEWGVVALLALLALVSALLARRDYRNARRLRSEGA
jgi:hypothetical protein